MKLCQSIAVKHYLDSSLVLYSAKHCRHCIGWSDMLLEHAGRCLTRGSAVAEEQGISDTITLVVK